MLDDAISKYAYGFFRGDSTPEGAERRACLLFPFIFATFNKTHQGDEPVPTKKPRIMVVMEEDSYNTFMRYKSLTSKSLSSVLSDVINEVAPTFAKLCDTLEAAAKMDQQAKQKLLSQMTEMQGQLSQSLQDMQQQDWVGGSGNEKASKGQSKAVPTNRLKAGKK